MTDELECFRKAAELGCSDLYYDEKEPHILLPSIRDTTVPHRIQLPDIDPRINRYAAAVCAEWWNAELQKRDANFRANQSRIEECYGMIAAARAFGKKYGGAK